MCLSHESTAIGQEKCNYQANRTMAAREGFVVGANLSRISSLEWAVKLLLPKQEPRIGLSKKGLSMLVPSLAVRRGSQGES